MEVMGEFQGRERRKHPRLDANFIISYHIKEPSSPFDLSQTKNVSQGGLLLTTNRYFEKGVLLEMTIRFPFIPDKIKLTGMVVVSVEKVKDLLYETHIQFADKSNEDILKEIGKYVEDRIKNG